MTDYEKAFDFSEQCPGKMKRYFENKMNARLKEYDLTSAYVPYILLISKNAGVSLKGLSALLNLDRAHTTRMMSKLAEHSLAENKNPDKRLYSVSLTEKGMAIEKIIKEEMTRITADLLSCFSEEEKKVWNNLWHKINIKMME